MTLERLEVRFSPTSADEQAIINALDALSEYGAKGRFLKSRLVRGYVRAMRDIAIIKAEQDPLSALDRVAQSMDSGSYYALRSLLYAPPSEVPNVVAEVGAARSPALAAEPTPAPVPVSKTSEVPAQDDFAVQSTAGAVEASKAAPEPVLPVRAPEPSPAVALAAIIAADPEPAFNAISEAAAPSSVVESKAENVLPNSPDLPAEPETGGDEHVAQAVEPQPKPQQPAVDWSQFAGLAGMRGGD